MYWFVAYMEVYITGFLLLLSFIGQMTMFDFYWVNDYPWCFAFF